MGRSRKRIWKQINPETVGKNIPEKKNPTQLYRRDSILECCWSFHSRLSYPDRYIYKSTGYTLKKYRNINKNALLPLKSIVTVILFLSNRPSFKKLSLDSTAVFFKHWEPCEKVILSAVKKRDFCCFHIKNLYYKTLDW